MYQVNDGKHRFNTLGIQQFNSFLRNKKNKLQENKNSLQYFKYSKVQRRLYYNVNRKMKTIYKKRKKRNY